MKINKTLKQIQEFEKEKLANWYQSELVSVYNKLQEYQTEE